jgi:hypothetical protein
LALFVDEARNAYEQASVGYPVAYKKCEEPSKKRVKKYDPLSNDGRSPDSVALMISAQKTKKGTRDVLSIY